MGLIKFAGEKGNVRSEDFGQDDQTYIFVPSERPVFWFGLTVLTDWFKCLYFFIMKHIF